MPDSMRHLFIDELHDIFNAEQQILQALPEVVKAAESPKLKDALKNHLQETKEHVSRLKKIFAILGMQPRGETCAAMRGLVEEVNRIIDEYPKCSLRDAALIAKAQRIEHYEISAYGTLRTFAKELDLDEVQDLLQDTLNEEGDADKQLTKLAEGGLLTTGINRQASQANKGEADEEEDFEDLSRRRRSSRSLSATTRSKSTNSTRSHTASPRSTTSTRSTSSRSRSTVSRSPARGSEERQLAGRYAVSGRSSSRQNKRSPASAGSSSSRSSSKSSRSSSTPRSRSSR